MRQFFILLKREVAAFFYSPVAYVVMFCFLGLTGFTFYIAVSLLNRGPAEATLVEVFFNLLPFWICALLTFPLITMRLFSEEFKLGTIEPLMTAPVQDWQIVLSKFTGALIFYIILWMPSALYFPIFEWVTKAHAAWSPGAYWGSYTFILLLGMFYLSIGCLASVLTSNQIVAAILSLAVIIMLFLAGLLSYFVLNVTPAFHDFTGYFSSIEHMGNFSRGIFDTRPIAYYLSMTTLTLAITYQVFQSRKWKL
ncbi:MAG: ABC transporter permease subunit [Chthoniobacteraceae bacterium]